MDRLDNGIILRELIGFRVKILKCNDKKQEGTEGEIEDETKHTLVIATEKGKKRVIKKTATFKIYVGKKRYVINGQEIDFRPYERTEKAMRFYKNRGM